MAGAWEGNRRDYWHDDNDKEIIRAILNTGQDRDTQEAIQRHLHFVLFSGVSDCASEETLGAIGATRERRYRRPSSLGSNRVGHKREGERRDETVGWQGGGTFL